MDDNSGEGQSMSREQADVGSNQMAGEGKDSLMAGIGALRSLCRKHIAPDDFVELMV